LPGVVDPAIIAAMLLALLKSMRPRQWVKNVFVFAPLVFDRQLFVAEAFLRTAAGVGLLCLISGVVYVINDIADLAQDRAHPAKRNRPIASGRLSIPAARLAALGMAALGLGLAFALHWQFGLIAATYLVLNLLYSISLKHVPIIDVFIVASGFVLRVGAGVTLITVERFSPWLYVCTTLIALYFGFGKRRAELQLLADQANSHRRVLDGYTIPLLDQFIAIISATTILAYSLYTFSADNLPANHLMMLTIPIVIYAIFRYLYLIHVEGEGGAPEELVLRDRPLMASFLLWGMTSVLFLYMG
jgi:4-hydroxybenzoate polyprenyltransferase